MNIIVTGGAGFIGSNFIFHMLKKYPDYRIICLDCLTYAGNLSTLAPVMDNPNFRFVKESITDREAVYKLFEEEHPDMVVNFATTMRSGASARMLASSLPSRRVRGWNTGIPCSRATSLTGGAVSTCLRPTGLSRRVYTPQIS